MAKGKIVVPDGKESLNVELWVGGSKGKYEGQITIHIDADVGLDAFVKLLETRLRSSRTTLKFKSRSTSKTKTTTLAFSAAQIKRELEELSKIPAAQIPG